MRPDGRQFDIDDIPELVLCVIGNPDSRRLAFHADPFVFGAVTQLIRQYDFLDLFHHSSLYP